MAEQAFLGFGPETFAFLRELAEHNDRTWFTQNRPHYEEYYLAPALAFISEIGPRLAKELPGEVHFEPRVNGSLFRINRDVRFSRDKAPYKDHIDMWFWTGDEKGWETPGYFMRLQEGRWAIGAGIHHFGKESLRVYRDAVVDQAKGAPLKQLFRKLVAVMKWAWRFANPCRVATTPAIRERPIYYTRGWSRCWRGLCQCKQRVPASLTTVWCTSRR